MTKPPPPIMGLSEDPPELLLDQAGGVLDGGDSGEATPFALGREPFQPVGRLAGLERMGERLARRLRQVIEPYARNRVAVTHEPIETDRFELFREALPAFTSLSLYRMAPLKGGMLLVIEPAFVSGLVDAFYGGAGGGAPSRATEFTPAEERLLGKLADGIVERLAEVWAEIVPLAPTFVSRETNASYASLVRGDETVVVQRFAVTPGQGRKSFVTIVYPLGSLRPVEAQLAAKVHDDAGPADAEWRARMAAALENVHLPVRSVLARPELSVSQLLKLKPGDVIPITLAPRVPLIVGSKRMGYGTIGEREGRAALMIDEIERGAK